MKEAPSNERAFLVSETPPIGKAPGAGYLEGRGIGSRSVEVTGRRQSAWWPKPWRRLWTSPWNGPLVSSLGTWNLVWNFGI